MIQDLKPLINIILSLIRYVQLLFYNDLVTSDVRRPSYIILNR